MATERKAPIGKKSAQKKAASKHKSAAKKAAPASKPAVASAPANVDRSLSIEWVPLSSVKPYGRNPRVISDKAVEKVRSSLINFGWQQPLVVDADRVLIVGHTRLMAAAKLGLAMIPIHTARNLTKQQARAYRLMDNRAADESRWDYDLAGEEIKALEQDGYDLSLTGFDIGEINVALGGALNDPNTEWGGMPEFVSEDERPARTLFVHFTDERHVKKFSTLLKQEITDRTKFVWYPAQRKKVFKDKSYAADDEES